MGPQPSVVQQQTPVLNPGPSEARSKTPAPRSTPVPKEDEQLARLKEVLDAAMMGAEKPTAPAQTSKPKQIDTSRMALKDISNHQVMACSHQDSLLTRDAIDVVAGMSPPRADKGEDDWVWGLESSGLFSVKTAYNLICETESRPTSSWWKAVWKWNGPNRIRHFLWLAVRDKLLTNDVRCRRGFCPDAVCNCCGSGNETILHVLRDCEFARDTWLKVGGFELNGNDWRLPLEEWFQLFLAKDKGLIFGITCWFLWRTRNERIFAGRADSAGGTAAKCAHWEVKVREAMNFEASVVPNLNVPRQSQVNWQAGQEGWVTVNSDGSVLGTRGRAAAGGILRQANGQGIRAYAMNLGVCSITRAEIRGALEGIKQAWNAGYRRVEVQLDSQAAIAILLDKSASVSHQHALEVLEFRDWLGRDWALKLKHVYREANRVADYLASYGHTLPRGSHSISLSDCNLAYHIRSI
ncbi:Putative ribonuclease H protein At1g65750 [Linum perenne]